MSEEEEEADMRRRWCRGIAPAPLFGRRALVGCLSLSCGFRLVWILTVVALVAAGAVGAVVAVREAVAVLV